MFPILLIFAILFCKCNHLLSQPCSNGCSGHGICAPNRQCQCFTGFTAGDCSQFVCPYGAAWTDIASGIDIAHQPAECSNMGLCDRTTGKCACKDGFEGNACERMSCPFSCNGQGKCQSMAYYAQTKDPGTGPVYSYYNIWDATKIYGCNCDSNFYGPDCSQKDCPTGDDPLTGNGVASLSNPTQYNEVQKITCKAGGGTFTLTFRGKTTTRIPYNANAAALESALNALPTISSVTIVMFSVQACTDVGASWTVEFTQDFGKLPLMIPDSSRLVFYDAISKPSLTVNVQTLGTKENDPCSNRGICDPRDGYCTCSTGYDTSNGYDAPGTRGDCGYATTTIQSCPGAISCSGHGVCAGDPTYRCACDNGWTGADCSERVCPKDTSWFTYPSSNNVAHVFENNECSDFGTCDRDTGVCQCVAGFTGASCNRISCPGATEDCSGHGACYDMMTLATYATINGDAASFTYGIVPNNPLTWDATRMYGCLCDPLWTGYDCSLRVCPYGNDPIYPGVDEQQIISCATNQTTGYVVFSFRQSPVAQLSYDATVAQIQAAFQAVSAIGKVAVELVDSAKVDSLCTRAGSQIMVTFLTTHGALPLLQYTYQNIDYLTVTRYKEGTKQTLECSGRGVCDRTLGVCQCFDGFGSSDGQGGSGTSGDCGYLLPVTQ